MVESGESFQDTDFDGFVLGLIGFVPPSPRLPSSLKLPTSLKLRRTSRRTGAMEDFIDGLEDFGFAGGESLILCGVKGGMEGWWVFFQLARGV